MKFTDPFDYVLVSGREGKIKLEGEENLLDYIITKVKHGTLIISTENRINLKPSRNKTIRVTVPFEDINAVSLSGSGDVWNENLISASDFKIYLAGSGDIRLEVKATSIDAAIAGSGVLVIKGTTHKLDVSVTGSGGFKSYQLDASDVDVSVTGSGDAEIVCNANLKARVTGSGAIKYKGNPKSKDSKVVGSGSISN